MPYDKPITINYMKTRQLLKSLLLLCALIVGSVSAWAADGDTHDFAQTLSQLLNNNAAISSINIAEQSYPVKKVVVSYRYNKTIKDAVTVSVSVAGTSWGSQNVAGTGSYYSTLEFTGDAATGAIVVSFTNNTGDGTGHGTFYVNNVQLVEGAAAVAGTTAAPSISGNTPFLSSTTVTISNASSASGASIFYTLNGDDPTTTPSATCFEYSEPFVLTSTTTVKAIAKHANDANASDVATKTFTKTTPLTVAEARAAIDAGTGTSNVYVAGIVCEGGSNLNNGALTYWISDDGTETDKFEIYKGKGLDGADFESVDDVKVGDEVVVFGNIKKYNSTYEFDAGSTLISLTRKEAPSFTLNPTEATLEASTHETVDVTVTTNSDGALSCESSNPAVATVALKSAGVYTITAQMEGSATITIKSAPSDNYSPASATVAVTVTDVRAEAGIAYANDKVEITWGDEFTGQTLTNPNALSVTYSSSNEDVATVDAEGVVTVKKSGKITIQATFDGNASYRAAAASYELNVKKASAGLSYAVKEFDVAIGDNSFVAPTLVNPHNLPVTYSSSNASVASVNETTGELQLVTTDAATVTITASFAGNDCYYNGTAKYTISIVDPNVKGSVFNPYTVAEVRAVETSETISDVYVEGYIVGYVNSTYGFTSDVTKFDNTNWAIADSPSETEADNSAPVQISSGNQPVYGLKNNPSLLGAKVLIKGDITKYFNVSGVKNLDKISVASVSVTITAAGYSTNVISLDLDFSEVAGLRAYKATVDGKDIAFTKVTTVPAGEGVLLQGDEGSYTVPVTTGLAAWDESENAFVRGTGAAVASEADGKYNYILNKVNGVVGFYKANDKKVAKNRAYLQTTSNDARINLNIEDETTGIADVNRDETISTALYDLSGRKIVKPTRGLYIVNGQKRLVK